MAEVPVLSGIAILDTSWLLELYRVPGYCEKSRFRSVREKTGGIIEAGGELFVTVPVLFEVANHITPVRDGRRRRTLREKFRDDVKRSLDGSGPWTIVATGKDILLRSKDVIRLAERFLQTSGENYSFANISIVDLAATLQGKNRTVEILSFNERLAAYSRRRSRDRCLVCTS